MHLIFQKILTYLKDCKFAIKVRTTEDGQNFFVKEMGATESHNHDINKVLTSDHHSPQRFNNRATKMFIIRSFFNKLQMPEYAIEDTTEKDKAEKRDYEERQYKPSVWVSTSVDLISPDRPTMKSDNTRGLFYKLFNYIQGKNDKEQKIEMTVPVTREYIPGQGPACETKCTMSFYVPREFAENPPTPTAPDVFITNRPAMTVFVRTFGGYANDEKCMEEMIKFLPILEADGHSVRDDVYYFAGYDSPWKFLNRKNEVWVLKKEKATKTTSVKSPATAPSTEAGKSD